MFGRGRGDWVEAIEQCWERVGRTQMSIRGGFSPNGSTAWRLALSSAWKRWLGNRAAVYSFRPSSSATRRDGVRARLDQLQNKGWSWKKQPSGVALEIWAT